MKPTWHNTAWGIHQKYLERAQQKGKLITDEEQQRFLALAIAGEAGELGNLSKKTWRGDEPNFAGIAEEMAYVRMYLDSTGIFIFCA
jgi:hypothetical protein